MNDIEQLPYSNLIEMPLTPEQLRDDIYLALKKRVKKYDIINVTKFITKDNDYAIRIEFHIANKDQYMDSYSRSLHMLRKFGITNTWGGFKICCSGFTSWQKDDLCVSLSLQQWNSGDNYPSTEIQVITIWEKPDEQW